MRYGADPEFFLWNTLKNAPLGAHHFFSGKNDKHSCENGQFFRDGYALELNPRAWSDPAFMIEDVHAILQYVKQGLKELNPDVQIKAQSMVTVQLAEIKEGPEDLHQFGCDP